MKTAYFVHDLADAAAARRAQMLRAGGAEVAAAGFRRSEHPVSHLAGVPALDLGRTFDGRLAHRAGLVALQCARAGALRELVRGADVILARNLEMLAIAAAARRAHAPKAKLVYECLDIHRALCGAGPLAAALRALEGSLLRSCSSLVVSAPAFVSEYFEKRHRRLPPILLVENKVLVRSGEVERVAPSRRPGPPWRIGWFGNLRCRKSVAFLSEIARRANGALEVVLRGKPSAHTLPDLPAMIADVPHMRFEGPYSQGELAAIYAGVHFAWSIDRTDEGLNSTWLLPNRIYEGSYFGTPSIAERNTAIGGWVASKGSGLLVDDPVEDTLRLITGLQPAGYESLEARTRSIDRGALAFDGEDCRRLVEQLAESYEYARPNGSGGFKIRTPHSGVHP